jgi:glucose dehydrogenase
MCARARALAAVIVVVAAALAGCGTSGRSAGAASAERGQAWSAPNADVANTRRVVGGPIDAASAPRLRRVWTVPITAPGFVATPVVAGGVAYLQDLGSNVLAVSLATGRVLWAAAANDPNVGPNGVNVGDGRVYGATNGSAFALDTKSGKQLWVRRLIRNGGEAIDMAPGYHDGTVYVSTALRGPGGVGVLWALDGATGRPKWKWAQVPYGLWGHPEVNAGGGLWHPPAFDGHGGLYIGIGNPLPFPGTAAAPWGRTRPGDNRWDNSLVKLDERTGKFIWGRQVLPHDIYDWDLQCPPILATVGGRQVVLASGKMGIVYAFDAERGTLLWQRPVGMHNGHDHDNLIAMRGGVPFRRPTTILPGNWGGVQTPMASDGRTVYVAVNNLSILYRSQTDNRQQNLLQGKGELVALDIATGRVRWDRTLPHSTYGAATISNDVVFTTTFEGTVWGLDTRTGKVVWHDRLPAGTDAPVGVSGGTLITAGSLPISQEQRPAIVAYRVG